MGKNIKITVKAPNQKIDDQVVECNIDWNIEKLKEEISHIYPNKPPIDGQRLIYSGHLLQNNQLLGDILQLSDDSKNSSQPTFHLVCKNSEHLKDMKLTQTTQQPNTTEVIQSGNVEESGTGINASFTMTNMANFSVMPSMMTSPEQMMQQMALMQQMYAQYMQHLLSQNLAYPPNTYPEQNMNINLGPTNTSTNQTPVETTQSPPPPAPQPAPVQQRAQQEAPPPVNAGPGGVPAVDDEDDPNNRDWLDWFYWFSRASIMLSIVYVYSSLSRFLVVVVIGALIYLYQMGIFAPQPQPPRAENRERENNQQYDNAPNENNPEVDNMQELQDMMDAEALGPRRRRRNGNNPGNDLRNNGNTTEERYTGLKLVWMMVSTLFTSLIPETPAPVNLN